MQTDIDADRILVTDQSGKQRISKSNALGQLTDIWEIMAASDSSTVSVTFPSQSIAYGYQTSYSYDTLNNLTTVSQGSQTRTFSYSSLSRLLTAANPESGTISYGYDNNGNLTNKTDARSVLTTYTYDNLNRVTQRSYSNEPSGQTATPTVTYTYDNLTNAKGKLIKVDNGFSKTEYTQFDLLGRVTKSKQTTDNTAYNEMLYSYNLSGALIEETYPSGRVVKNTLDNDGELAQVQSKKANDTFRNYANSFNYTASGAVSSMRLGNGLWENTSFNARLQPTQIGLGSGATSQNLLKLNYDYGSTANNGNVQSQTITVPTVGANTGFTATQTYTYDSLNRLKDAKEMIGTTETWKQTFTFDRYGNRNFDEANTTTLPKNCGTSPNFTVCAADRKVLNPSVDTSNNRLNTSDDYTFDSSGNTTADAQGRTFIYDAENKQIEVKNSSNQTIGQYFYDGDGKRVKKVSATETTIFVYDASGKMVAEYSTQLATTPQVSYLTSDHLGSPRINTDANGAVTARHDYQPFGEEIATSQRNTGLGYNSDEIRKKFTGYERDIESFLDFAQARYYSSKLGRFYSVDPENAGASEDDPQSWNGYAYSRNNPVLYSDPDGLEYKVCNDEGRCWTHSDDQIIEAQGAGGFDWVGTQDQKNGLRSGIILDEQGNKVGEYQQTSHDSQIQQMLWGAANTLDIWEPVIEFVQPVPIPFLGPAVKGVQLGLKASKLAKVTKAAKAASKVPKLCFVEGTPILTENGLKPIEEIREGDRVLSYNEKTKQTEYKTVVQTMVREAEAGRILSVKVEGEEKALGVTGEHPFYVRIHRARDSISSEDDNQGEWIEAKVLQIGDEIRKANNSWAKVESISQKIEGAKVYNLEVIDNHNYFVGKTQLLVHNGSNDCLRVIQSSGHTLKNSTIKALQEAYRQQYGREVSREGLKKALEAMKKAELGPLANATHGKILANGDLVSRTGEFIGNILQYIP